MKRYIVKLYIMIAVLIALANSGCATSGDIFNDVGTNLACPSAMVIDPVNTRLYLVNSNSKVLYDFTQGSFQIYDISNPVAPSLLNTAQTSSFSGQIYLDTVAAHAYVPNRYTPNDQTIQDNLYDINVDSVSPSYMSVTSSTLADNAYAIGCCYPVATNRAWITTTQDSSQLQYVDLGINMTATGVNLAMTLDTGDQVTSVPVNQIAIIGSQAFLSRENGGIVVVDLDTAGAAGAVPVFYFISDVEAPQGLAASGTDLYIAGAGYDAGGNWVPDLLVLDTTKLPARADSTKTLLVDKDTAGMVKALTTVGNNPQNVALSTAYAFVTNQNDNTVSVVNRATYAVDKTITVGVQPFSVVVYTTVGGVDSNVYVGNVEDNTISVIDIPTLSVVATYP